MTGPMESRVDCLIWWTQSRSRGSDVNKPVFLKACRGRNKYNGFYYVNTQREGGGVGSCKWQRVYKRLWAMSSSVYVMPINRISNVRRWRRSLWGYKGSVPTWLYRCGAAGSPRTSHTSASQSLYEPRVSIFGDTMCTTLLTREAPVFFFVFFWLISSNNWFTEQTERAHGCSYCMSEWLLNLQARKCWSLLNADINLDNRLTVKVIFPLLQARQFMAEYLYLITSH